MNGSDQSDWKLTARTLSEILAAVGDDLSRAGLRVQVEGIPADIYAGEYLLALEQICSHLEDTGTPVSPRLKGKIEEIGRRLGADPVIWSNLKQRSDH